MSKITRPIGLKEFVDEVEAVCDKAVFYRRYGLRPYNLILKMDSGCGRTTAVSYMADRFEEARVMDFRASYDRYIEISVSRDPVQFKEAFNEIRNAAVYSNEYRNIISMNMDDIAKNNNNAFFEMFIDQYHKYCERALTVYFFPFNTSGEQENFIKKLCEHIYNTRLIDVKPYLTEDIRNMIIFFVREHGICLEDDKVIENLLQEIIEHYGTSTPADAIRLADLLVCFSDINGGKAELSVRNIKIARDYLCYGNGGIWYEK